MRSSNNPVASVSPMARETPPSLPTVLQGLGNELIFRLAVVIGGGTIAVAFQIIDGLGHCSGFNPPRSSPGWLLCGRGPGRVEPPRGILVAYAARDGEVAVDGDDANSPSDRRSSFVVSTVPDRRPEGCVTHMPIEFRTCHFLCAAATTVEATVAEAQPASRAEA